ncbi:MAG: FAD/NAD(P)-binding protein [Solirubrobacterales bacterium]
MAANRIAIVGFGPRGLGALERLIAHQRISDSTPIEVTVFEPGPTPGAGSAYSPDQPSFLLMNFPAGKIDFRWDESGTPSAFGGGSFMEWAEADPDRADGWYPPRSLVGSYLSAAASELLDSSPFPVTLVSEAVVGMEPGSGGWLIRTKSGASRFDEVLLTTGHAPTGSRSTASADLAVAGSEVNIRGFGLTAIDLILELTEGGGGSFEPAANGSFKYRRSASEPSGIAPHSRHGRPMLVKPELSRSPVPAEILTAVIADSREQVLELPPGAGITQLGKVLSGLCADLLSLEPARQAAGAWIDAASTGQLGPDPDPAATINESLRIASGETSPNLKWALGLAWRSIYPAIVRRYSHGGLRESDHSPFRNLASEMERLAFGPPPVNAAKLLALADAGILDLSRLADSGSSGSGIELDAVSSPPGLNLHQEPLADLVAAGAIRKPPGARGIEVTRSARCVGANGETTRGLAACGRLTEDWVIGNDTLDRRLHPEINRWAETVCSAIPTESSLAAIS